MITFLSTGILKCIIWDSSPTTPQMTRCNEFDSAWMAFDIDLAHGFNTRRDQEMACMQTSNTPSNQFTPQQPGKRSRHMFEYYTPHPLCRLRRKRCCSLVGNLFFRLQPRSRHHRVDIQYENESRHLPWNCVQNNAPVQIRGQWTWRPYASFSWANHFKG